MGKKLGTIALIIIAALLVVWDQTFNNGLITAFLGDYLVVLLALGLILGVIGLKTGI